MLTTTLHSINQISTLLPISILSFNNSESNLNATSTYHIPKTEITLHLTSYDNLVPFQALKRSITQVGSRARAHILEHGDGWLWAQDDPFVEEVLGCTFFAKSNPNPGPAPAQRQVHLTYGIMISVAAGLWQWMLIRDHLNMVIFDIEDAKWGIVGIGTITPY